MKEETNPWQILSGEEIYDNPWINLTEYKVINPGGGHGIYGKVHFKNFAIGIIPLDEENNTWIVGQYRFTVDDYSWEIPMGGGALQKGVLESAQRELLEETGISAKSWKMILKVHLSNSVSDELGFVFVARELSQGLQILEETEKDLKVRKLPFEDVFKMVQEGKITDSLSVAGILRAGLDIF